MKNTTSIDEKHQTAAALADLLKDGARPNTEGLK